MVVEIISESVFNDFVQQHPQHSFYQTLGFVKRRKADGWDYEILGFMSENNLCGVGLFYKRKVLFNKYRYECLGGPLLDLDHFEESIVALKDYLNKHNACECMINPNLIAYKHNLEVDEKVEHNNFEKLKETLTQEGFVYDEHSDDSDATLNWFYKKDLDMFTNSEDLLESFERETKRLVGLSLNNNLSLEDLEPHDFTRLKKLLDMTALSNEFDSRSLSYFNALYESYNEYEKARFVVVTLDVEAYRKPLLLQRDDLTDKIQKDQELNTKRSLNRAQQNQDVLNAVNKKLELMKDVDTETIDLCGGVFLYTAQEISYILGGSDPRYFTFNGPQFLQWHMMLDALEKEIPRYNFYGTRGSFMGRPEEDGVYFFKRGFNGYLVENFGFYEYQAQGLINSVIANLKKIKHKLK